MNVLVIQTFYPGRQRLQAILWAISTSLSFMFYAASTFCEWSESLNDPMFTLQTNQTMVQFDQDRDHGPLVWTVVRSNIHTYYFSSD